MIPEINFVAIFIGFLVIGIIVGGLLFWGLGSLASHIQISVRWV